MKEEFAGFGPTFAQEKLRQRHGYYLSEETLRKWMIQEGLWEAKLRRNRRFIREEFVEVDLVNYCKRWFLGMTGLRAVQRRLRW